MYFIHYQTYLKYPEGFQVSMNVLFDDFYKVEMALNISKTFIFIYLFIYFTIMKW